MIKTDLGEKEFYDALSICNRCGYCEQACPTYAVSGKEGFSGRGRNQIVRMMVEGRLKDCGAAAESLSTCLLCGACKSVCFAHVPTEEIVLEGRRRIRGGRTPWIARMAERVMLEKPLWMGYLLKFVNLLRRARISSIVSSSRVLGLLGLGWLERAEENLSEAPLKFLYEYLQKDPFLAPPPQTILRQRRIRLRRTAGHLPTLSGPTQLPPEWLYFPCCGTNYLFPRIGLATVSILKACLGPGRFFGNSCCGLLAYNYGTLEGAREFAKRNIEIFERVLEGSSGPIVVGDCSSCVAHMKEYSKLFDEDSQWKERAERFSRSVRDILEVIPLHALRTSERASGAPTVPSLWLGAGASGSQRSLRATGAPGSSGSAPRAVAGALRQEAASESRTITYHDSCRARNSQGIVAEPRRILSKLAGKRYVELAQADQCCGGAGIFTFVHPGLSDEILRRKISSIAETQADVVATSSTSCLIQLAHGLKKYYPECRVLHLSEIASEHVQR